MKKKKKTGENWRFQNSFNFKHFYTSIKFNIEPPIEIIKYVTASWNLDIVDNSLLSVKEHLVYTFFKS